MNYVYQNLINTSICHSQYSQYIIMIYIYNYNAYINNHNIYIIIICIYIIKYI